ncbi:MAG TPA: ribonuclease HI [Rectinemataceae bacterium]|nr:ribonuclease HI [Rectinemataceae bacterium]
MDDIVIYTDGGCSGNPGPGGWAFILEDSAGEAIGSGGEAMTTNNRMELRAVIEALKAAEGRQARKEGAPVTLFTDSQYVKNGISSWIKSWKRNGWRTSDKKPVKNKELWEELDAVAARLKPEFLWVEGHAGVVNNERCDSLVQDEIRLFR